MANDTALPPLYWPGGIRPSAEMWRNYRFRFVPILVAVCRSRARRRALEPVFVELDSQFRGRPAAAAWAAWNARGAQLRFIQILSTNLCAEMGWPNCHLIPQDPLEIVFFCRDSDGGELMHAMYLTAKAVDEKFLRIAPLSREMLYREFTSQCWAAVEHSVWARTFDHDVLTSERGHLQYHTPNSLR